MRTTLTLDHAVAATLKAGSRRAGRPFRDVVNETLRRGLASHHTVARRPFTIETRDLGDLGDLRPGLSLDKVAELLERGKGSTFR